MEAVRTAIERTAAERYSYRVRGKFDRTGEFKPTAVLTATIASFRSARNGGVIFVKGPEGLWKTPDERLGEQVQNPDKEAVEIVQTLWDAEPPHRMLLEILPKLEKGRTADDKKMDGIQCKAYYFRVEEATLRPSIERQLQKAIDGGAIPKPDTIQWSTLKSSVRIYVDRSDGTLVHVYDERSVKIAYKGSGTEESRLYRNDMEYTFSGHAQAKLQLPKEILERLGIEE